MNKIRTLGLNPTNPIPKRSLHSSFNRVHFILGNPLLSFTLRITKPAPRLRRRRRHPRRILRRPAAAPGGVDLVPFAAHNLQPPVCLVAEIAWPVIGSIHYCYGLEWNWGFRSLRNEMRKRRRNRHAWCGIWFIRFHRVLVICTYTFLKVKKSILSIFGHSLDQTEYFESNLSPPPIPRKTQ
ncbi:hypothetical protein Hanom_Chr01g00001951 [Helianthus anomalus]